ncbi:hypothetical protein DB354_11935 [Opitutus sp. ER46]|nr:hypothetical protein DB354_11935 [Opitutus sp. ER46]
MARGATDPAFTASYLRAYRAGVRQEYWDFLRQRGATEEQVQGVIEIMAKWKEAALDARAAASADQTAMAAAEIKASDARSLETRDAALRALLGPDAVGQLEGYDGTKRQRILVADIAAPAFAIGEPLSGAQSRELVRLISSSNLGIRREGAAYVGPTDSEYDALFSRASAFLTPNQVAVMREILVKQREDLARLTR